MKKALLTLLLSFFSFIDFSYALNNITINNNKLVPSFEKNTTTYNVFVNSKIEIITINVDAEDGEIITGSGSKSLKKGLNEIEIMVYNSDTLTKKYILNIVRGEIEYDKNDSSLKNIIVENHEINFDTNIHEYEIEANDDETKLNISYETVNPKSKIKLTGGTLNKEENIVKIEVISENNKNKSEYILKVTKKIETKEKNKNTSIFGNKEFSKFELKMIIIALVTTGAIILGILFYFIFIKKRKKYALKLKRISFPKIKKKD